MSRQIDIDKPLSDEDRAWLLSRSRHDDILYNDRLCAAIKAGQVKALEDDDSDSDDDDDDDGTIEISQHIYDTVIALDENGLKTKLSHYGLPPVGSVSEMRTQLALFLQDREDDVAREEMVEKARKEKFNNDPTK